MKKIIILVCVIWNIILFIFFGTMVSKSRYPSHSNLKVENGIIHHPVYGDYPEEIPFEQGMTLMPGQSTTYQAVVKIK